jgi:hypothetical protein
MHHTLKIYESGVVASFILNWLEVSGQHHALNALPVGNGKDSVLGETFYKLNSQTKVLNFFALERQERSY